jgi:hypothetical protein
VTGFKRFLIGAGLLVGLILLASEAQAEDAVCRGRAPAVGEVLRGPVLHVIDAQRLCIALDVLPDHWVEVQVIQEPLLQASTGANPRGTLMALAFAQDAICQVTGKIDGRPLATCTIGGQDVAQRLRQPDAIRIGQAWR